MKKYFSTLILGVSVSIFLGQNLTPVPMPCTNITQGFNSGTIASLICIEDVGNTTTQQTINVSPAGYTEHKAGNYIEYDGEMYIAPANSGDFLALIEQSSVSTIWYEPNNTPGIVPKYHKLELGFKLDAGIENDIYTFLNGYSGLNPFNPDAISVDIALTGPDGTVTNTHGFYYKPFIKNLVTDTWDDDTTSFYWRLRFAPDQIGNWTGAVTVNAQGYPQKTSAFSFNCVVSGHKGILKTSNTGTEADRYLYESETGNTFIAIGHNITTRGPNITPSKNDLHKHWLQELAFYGGNFFRMEMPAGGALPDWPENYNGGTSSYPPGSENSIYNYENKLDQMYGYDEVVSLAEALEMYFIMFRHHVELGPEASWGVNWDSWTNNPYKKAFNLTNSNDYFQNTQIIAIQQRCLRYIFARWGYSPNFAFYGYSEVNGWVSQVALAETDKYELFSLWSNGMKSYRRVLKIDFFSFLKKTRTLFYLFEKNHTSNIAKIG